MSSDKQKARRRHHTIAQLGSRAGLTAAGRLLIGCALALSAISPAAARTSGDSRIIVSVPGQQNDVVNISARGLFHTFESDFFLQDDGTMYVQTGDIPAMWLRDSSAQTLPYVRFLPYFPALAPTARQVIERNARNVLTDPYANAFTAAYRVWEEKWEPDSLAYPINLAWSYWKTTGDRGVFTQRLQWSFIRTLRTYDCEQHHATCSGYTSAFLPNRGRGAHFVPTGMVWSAFRPSDDPVRYPFNIPQEMLAAVSLTDLADMEQGGFHDFALASRARLMAQEIRAGVERYGVVYDMRFGWIYAYEVDGRGNSERMDDANLPNLLSAIYFGYTSASESLYQNTRRFVLSPYDPYYYRGRYAAGLGSSHTPTGWVWPLAMIARGLTAATPAEVAQALLDIQGTRSPQGYMRESFDPNDPNRFTRAEFGWANALYAELVFRSVAELSSGADARTPDGTLFAAPVQTPRVVGSVEALRNAEIIASTLQSVLDI
ncbi:MAG: glycoside hydrolase family 125 protein [Candidatus Eremiobacteraeota bacterium]|nr:glycoside hydrolase family 125 protein [Candidatus Eremiobacteraeota bacterium]